jgi:mannose-6-phosphate isomerase-like protein (cupin superfamily)
MSPDWKPDDSVIEGRTGAQRIRASLKKHGINVKEGVITSRDPGMNDVRYALRRPDMPPGFQSWQLPVFLEGCPVFFFLTVAEPGAVVPSHSHQRDLFRVVVAGSITTNGIELKAGDWMFVPKGTPYNYSAGLNPGAISFHCYG